MTASIGQMEGMLEQQIRGEIYVDKCYCPIMAWLKYESRQGETQTRGRTLAPVHETQSLDDEEGRLALRHFLRETLGNRINERLAGPDHCTKTEYEVALAGVVKPFGVLIEITVFPARNGTNFADASLPSLIVMGDAMVPTVGSLLLSSTVAEMPARRGWTVMSAPRW